MTNPVRVLTTLGQSVWYDNLSRELVRSGELKRLIDENGISGVTSNPTIFERSISNQRTYDHDIHVLVDTGSSVQEIYEQLVAQDVREAADLLGPVYEQSEGMDGYVSLEVSPHLAYDSDGTVDEALRLWALVDRRNLMIKIPATSEGFKAVPVLLGQGINVNITLVFSLDQYRDAVTAYIEGLDRWIAAGGHPAQLACVASFFVSRVDTVIDEILREVVDPKKKPVARSLLGKAAIANAKVAYAMFLEAFHGSRFAPFFGKGARVQRLVWASTSTKDPEYPDTYYVDALIGPETINTVPRVSLDAYMRHGNPAARLQEGIEAARDLFPKLGQMGVDLDDVMDELLEDGVRLFADSYDQLLAGIAKKRTRLLRGWGHRSASLGDLQKRVDDKLTELDTQKMGDSLWRGDVSLWGDDPERGAAIAKRLGWLQVVETMTGETHRLKNYAEGIRDAGFAQVILLGMGGSCLSSEVFATCFGSRPGFPELKVLDTTVPATILQVDREIDPERTLFVVASKSGKTMEVACLYEYFRAKLENLYGDKAGSNFMAITDPGTSVGRLAASKGFRRTFLNPPTIGGRFSALSYFGLVPAALIGMDVDRLLMRATQSLESAGPEVPALENQGLWLGTCMAEANLVGKNKVSFILSPGVASFGYWLEQLIGESTGKDGKGILPVVGEPVGSPEVYGDDRLFVYLRLDEEGGYDQEVSDLERFGHPVITLRLHTPFDLGREVFRWQMATAIAGAIMGINPFDEPNVVESKDITGNILEAYVKEQKLPESEGLQVTDEALPSALAEFLASSVPGDYVAFNAFIQPTAENLAILQSMRTVVRDRFKTATAMGFGPRYLHCTGQIHKGGPNNGLFVMITADDKEDASIPGSPYTFGVLKMAQALGDYQALKNLGRRIVRVHLRDDSDLIIMAEALKAGLA